MAFNFWKYLVEWTSFLQEVWLVLVNLVFVTCNRDTIAMKIISKKYISHFMSHAGLYFESVDQIYKKFVIYDPME